MTDDDDAPRDSGTAGGLMRAALMRALRRPAEDADGTITDKAQLIANRLTDKAADGDMQAIKEVYDRADGRSAQAPAAPETPRLVTFRWKNAKPNSITSPGDSSSPSTSDRSDSPAS